MNRYKFLDCELMKFYPKIAREYKKDVNIKIKLKQTIKSRRIV